MVREKNMDNYISGKDSGSDIFGVTFAGYHGGLVGGGCCQYDGLCLIVTSSFFHQVCGIPKFR